MKNRDNNIIEDLGNPRQVFSMEEFLINEFPNQLPYNYERHEDWEGNNEKEAQRIMENYDYLGIFNFKDHLKYKIFSNKEDDKIFYYLLHTDFLALLFLHEIKEIKLLNLNGIESVDIWQNHVLRGSTKNLARYWIFEYILKNYNFIMSDQSHTPLGTSFYTKLITEALDRKLKIVVNDLKDKKYIELINIDQIKDFYGDQNKNHYRFIIFKEGVQ